MDEKAYEKKYTVGEAIDHLGFGRFQIMLVIVVGMAYMADTMEIMVLSILAPALSCEWSIEPWEEAFMTSIVFFGKLLTH